MVIRKKLKGKKTKKINNLFKCTKYHGYPEGLLRLPA